MLSYQQKPQGGTLLARKYSEDVLAHSERNTTSNRAFTEIHIYNESPTLYTSPVKGRVPSFRSTNSTKENKGRPLSGVNVPKIPSISCTCYLFELLDKGGHRLFLRDGSTGQSLTYRQVLNRSKGAVGWFKKETRPGDVVCLYARNKPDYVTAFLGITGSGASVCQVNPEFTIGELEHTVDSVRAVCIVADPDNVDIALKILAKNKTVQKIVVFSKSEGDLLPSDVTSFEEVIREEPSNANDQGDPKRNVLHILTSSGTTGLPKLVSLSHYSRVANIIQLSNPSFRVFDPEVGDVLLLCVPMHLMFATVLWTHALAEGAVVVTLPRFKPESFLKAIESFKVTVLPMVPSLALFLNQSPLTEKYNLSSLKKMVIAGAPLSPSVAQEVKQKFKLESFRPGYGMTEAGHLTFVSHSKSNLKSIGFPLPETEFEVRDIQTGVRLGPNQQGEFFVRGPQLMQGYLGQKNVFDSNGYLRTGDVGYYDESGEYYFVERIKDILKVKGHQVAPAELESVLLEHPAVSDVGVVGLPDEWAGEVPLAFVVLNHERRLLMNTMPELWRKNEEKLAKELQDFVAERTCRIKHLTGGVRFVDSISRTASGKILRRQLRSLLEPEEDAKL